MKDRKERTGKRDTRGLEGPVLQIVEGDRKASNWWCKLDVVLGLMFGEPTTLKTLVNTTVYLKWINTGQV